MRTIVVVVLAAASASFCYAAGATPVSKSEYPKIRAAMEDELLDARSARLKDVEIFRSKEGGDIVCGKVNAKNSYGAYVGYQPFQAMRLSLSPTLYMLLATGEVAGISCDRQRHLK